MRRGVSREECCDVPPCPASEMVKRRAAMSPVRDRPGPESGLGRWQPLAAPARPGQGRVAPEGPGLEAVGPVWLLFCPEGAKCSRRSISIAPRQRDAGPTATRGPVNRAAAGASLEDAGPTAPGRASIMRSREGSLPDGGDVRLRATPRARPEGALSNKFKSQSSPFTRHNSAWRQLLRSVAVG